MTGSVEHFKGGSGNRRLADGSRIRHRQSLRPCRCHPHGVLSQSDRPCISRALVSLLCKLFIFPIRDDAWLGERVLAVGVGPQG